MELVDVITLATPPHTLTVYDDNRQDLGGDVARRVAAQA